MAGEEVRRYRGVEPELEKILYGVFSDPFGSRHMGVHRSGYGLGGIPGAVSGGNRDGVGGNRPAD